MGAEEFLPRVEEIFEKESIASTVPDDDAMDASTAPASSRQIPIAFTESQKIKQALWQARKRSHTSVLQNRHQK